MVRNRTAQVEGLNVFYREAGEPGGPKLLLLGGFPASSHQFRQPDPRARRPLPRRLARLSGLRQHRHAGPTFAYTFDRLSEIVEGLLETIGLPARWALSAGLRRADGQPDRRPPPGLARVAGDPELQRVRGGLHGRLGRIRHALWVDASPETEAPLMPFLELEGVKLVYTHGTGTPSDQPRQLEHGRCTSSSGPTPAGSSSTCSTTTARTSRSIRAGRRSCASAGRKTLILWGQNDIFFTPRAARRTCATCPRPS